MNALPIPKPALENHVAVLGKTGSGKSNLAKLIATFLLKKKRRTCIIDPTGTWWGLRLNADGRPSPFPIVIFGGEHGDIAIGDAHGAAIAETIGTSSTPAIVDTRLMTVGARTRFFTDFSETLLRTNQGPLTLIIDEAHLFAPQGRVNDPRSGAMVHAANNLVSLGRGIGLSIVLISQRPAKLHKDSLTQAETLVAMRLIHNLDVDAVRTWIGECADPAEGKELVGSLPRLKVGEAWVWAPALDFLKQVAVPLVDTFDSGKPLAGRKAPELGAIDVEKITAKLEVVGKEVLANDPARLKLRISELTRELQKAQQNIPQNIPAPDPAALEEAHRAGYALGIEQALRFAGENFANAFDYARQAAEAVEHALAADRDRARKGEWALEFDKRPPQNPVSRQVQRSGSSLPPSRPSPARGEGKRASAGVDLKVNAEGISPGAAEMLGVLVTCYDWPINAQLWGAFCGKSPVSGSWHKAVAELKAAGLIQAAGGSFVAEPKAMTAAGVKPAGIGSEVALWAHYRATISSLIGPLARDLLEVLARHRPHDLTARQWALLAGKSPVSGSWHGAIKQLKKWDLIAAAGRDRFGVTDKGVAIAGIEGGGDTRATLRAARLARLSPLALEIFAALPGARADLAKRLGKSPISGSWHGAIKELLGSGLADERDKIIGCIEEELG